MHALAHTLHRGTPPPAAARVAAHLMRLLSTCAATSASAPSYGVVGGAAHVAQLLQHLPHAEAQLLAVLAGAIVQHEPRLSDVRLGELRVQPGIGATLQLRAQLMHGAPIAWQLHIDPRGHVRVQL